MRAAALWRVLPRIEGKQIARASRVATLAHQYRRFRVEVEKDMGETVYLEKHRRRNQLKRRIVKNWELYLFLAPALIALLLFNYAPMYGVQIAFKDYKSYQGIWGSEWVGLEHFQRFVGLNMFPVLMRNTLFISFYSLLAGFPLPILLALALNACDGKRFKRVVQTVTYAPHFISTVVVVGMINLMFSPSTGIIITILQKLGLASGNLNVLLSPGSFRHLYVWSNVWSSLGWNSIVYLSALSAVDPSLHEAAVMDGATKAQRCRHIDLPCIVPTIVMLLILRSGSIMSVGFQKVYLMQNSMNLDTSEVLSTYVYKQGMRNAEYSYSTAIDLFNSIINFLLLYTVNFVSRRLGENSLW